MCFLLSMKLDLVNPSGLNVNLTKQVLLCQKRCEVPRVFERTSSELKKRGMETSFFV